MALISTIIPTYRRADLVVNRALASVQAQGMTDWECLVVGEGTDRATERAMAQVSDPRVRFWNIPRPQYPRSARERWKVAGTVAFNFGLRQATGTWVSYLADDDEYTHWHHERLLGHAKPRIDMVYGKCMLAGRPDWIYGTYPPSQFATTQGAYIIRREKCPPARTEPSDVAWDALWWRDVIASGITFDFADEVVMRYHPNPTTLRFHGTGA